MKISAHSMPTHLFFLGRHPQLSVAEISAYLPDKDFLSLANNILSVQSEITVEELRNILKTLGGTIKIGQLLKDMENKNAIVPDISKYLQQEFDKKITFGISVYGLKNFGYKKNILNIKRSLQKSGNRVRFVNQGEKNVDSNLVMKEGLLTDKGCEINLVRMGEKVIMARTIASQDIETYSKRDYYKPCRDTKSGLLPPKLAQMLLNIAQSLSKKPLQTVWDPFCGSGVVLLEGLLMGYKMIGSDISKKAIRDSQENILWLYEQFGFDGQAKLFLQDATKKWQETFDFDAIVTETYLGPPQKSQQSENRIREIVYDLEKLYIQFFRNLKPLVKKNQIIVIAFPCFRNRNNWIYLEKILEKLRVLGYNPVDLIDKEVQKKFGLEIGERTSLVYSRPEQWVGREIIGLKIQD